MTKPKIAFVTSIYQDTNFTSGGVKLNAMLLEELKQYGYTIDLFSNCVVNNNRNIIDNIYSIKELENNRDKYYKILSDKGVVPSDITYVHDHSYPFRIKALYNRFSHFLYKIIYSKKHKKRLSEFEKIKQNLQNTKFIIVSSNILRDDVIKNYELEESKVIIIPPPIKLQTKIEHLKGEKKFVFGISAVGFERKGGYILLNAIRKLKRKNKNFCVNIIYEGQNILITILIYLYGIRNYCNFIGYYKNMNDFYNSIDCLLMPSILEPFGMVATEGMMCGCPVISNERCGGSDFVKNGTNCFVYKFPRDSFALANYMQQMIDLNKENYYKMRKKAYNSVQNLSKDKFTKKYLELMSDIA